MALVSEKSHHPRNRKSSTVSFDDIPSAQPAGSKNGRQPPQVQTSRFISSARSGFSTASTWTFSTRPAASLQALRNRILITIEKALSLVSEFRQTYLTNPEDDFHGVYQEFVRQLLTRVGYKNDLVTTDHLDSVIIKRFQTDVQIARRSDFKALTEVCARAKAFRDLKVQVQDRIDEVYNYTDIFCVTFSSETEGLSFECVENYENIKTACLRDLIHSLDQVQICSDELKDIQPLPTYLEAYSRVLNHIEVVVDNLDIAAQQLKRWVIADEQYEKAIEREIRFVKHRSNQVAGDRVSISSTRYEVNSRAVNESGKTRRVELTSCRLKSSLSKLHESRKAIVHSMEEVKEKLREARRELVTVEKQSSRRLRLSEFSELAPSADRLTEKINVLLEKEDNFSAKLNDIDTKIVTITREIHSLEQEKLRRKRCEDLSSQHVREQRTSLQRQTSALSSLRHKLQILNKLKSLKQNKETLKKMEFNMINIDYKEAMQVVIFDIAYKIGANWPHVYMKLPFLPGRSADKLENDIKAIRAGGSQAGRSEAEMGVMAFEKWAKRSTSATINELVFASKSFTEAAARRHLNHRAKYCVPRIKKRFQQLNVKTNVIYV